MWKQVLGDVNVSLRNEEWKVYLETRDQLQFQVTRAGWIGDYRDPYTFLSYLRGDIGVQHPSGYKSAAYDGLNDQSTTETDRKSAGAGKSGAVRGDLGGRRIMKTKKRYNTIY